MKPREWLRKWPWRSLGSLRQRPIRRPRPTRLLAEELEPRCVPSLVSLAQFTGANQSPSGILAEDPFGNLYGTTPEGGVGSALGDGTIYEVPQGSGIVTTVADFNGVDGATPVGGLVADSSGNRFGTTYLGGANNLGTIFELPSGSTSIVTLQSFVSNSTFTEGSNPVGPLFMDASGNIFGTASHGGIYAGQRLPNGIEEGGTLFELTTGNVLQVLCSFNADSGDIPEGGVIEDSSGNLFGTLSSGGPYGQSSYGDEYGTVFELPKGSHTPITLAAFNGTNGAYPVGGLVMDGSGNLFGTTFYGGQGYNGRVETGYGTVFEIKKNSNTFTTIATFNNGITGENPTGPLVMDDSGNLFGTTLHAGGGVDFGTVFEVKAGSNTLTSIGNFGFTGGSSNGLTQDSDGNLFCATDYGVFQYTLPALVTPSTLASWTVNQPGYNQTLSATGGTGVFTYSLIGGTLPGGLALASNGVISGTPTTVGTYFFTVLATDSAGNQTGRTFSIFVNTPVALLPENVVNWTVSSADSQFFNATGGTLPYVFTAPGGVPPGLSLSGSGLLSGTPTAPGIYHFTVTVTDLAGSSASMSYTIDVNSGTATSLNAIGGGLWIYIAGADTVTLSTTGGKLVINDSTPGQTIADNTGKFTITGSVGNETATETANLAGDFNGITISGSGNGQTVNFNGGSFLATSVNDGTIPTVHFGTGLSTFSGNLAVQSSSALTVSTPILGFGTIVITAAGNDTALTINANITSENTAVTLQATGGVTIGSGIVVNSGLGSLTLAADTAAGGGGDDGVGTLTINAGAGVYGSAINLRGADVDIASTATVGSTVASWSLPTTPSATLMGLSGPLWTTYDGSGNIYVSNFSGGGGTTVSKFGFGFTASFAMLPGLSGPVPLAFDKSGNLYVGNYTGNTLTKFAPGATTGSTFATGLSNPRALAFDSSGNLYVANQGSAGTVSVFSPSGTPLPSLTAGANPYTLAFDSNGNLYVANYGGNSVYEYSPSGTLLNKLTTGLNQPVGLAFDSGGDLYVANLGNSTVSRFTSAGAPITPALSGLSSPQAMAFDGGGNLYVANTGANTVSKFAPGATTPTTTLKGLSGPSALSFDGAGNLYVANFSNSTVSVFFQSNIAATTIVNIRSSLSSRPMSLGGTNNAAVAGINLTSSELAQIFTSASGTITFGDSSQTGNITFTTATPGTTAGTAIVALQASGGPGAIVLDDGAGSGIALNGNGGTISLIAGTGGIVALSASNSAAELATTAATVTLNTLGPIGTISNRIQLADNTNVAQQNVVIGTTLPPLWVYLDGLGSLTLGSIRSGAVIIDVTARTNLVVAANATVNAGSSTLSLGADLTPAEGADDGVGTLTISAGAAVYGGIINLRGADMDIASTATVGSAIATSVLPSTPSVSFLSGLPLPAGPLALAIDSTGNLYVANYSANTVFRFAPGAATFSGLLGASGPAALAFDSTGNLYVGNYTGNTVTEFSPGGTLLNTLTGLSNPRGLAFDTSGNLYVANQGSTTVSKFAPGATTPTATLNAQAGPYTLAFDSRSDLYVANSGANTVSEFAPDGRPLATLGGLNTPDALAVDRNDNLYVANQSGTTVSMFAPNGTALTPLSGLSNPTALAFDAFGNLYVANAGNNTISEFAPNGTLGATLSGLSAPYAMAFDRSGDLYVANFTGSTVSEFTTTYIPTTSSLNIRGSLPGRQMSLGGTNNSAVVGVNLTSAELARIFTTSSGAIGFGDGSQTGNIGFVTATPATTHGASTVVMQSGSGQITVNHNSSNAVALNGNGGTITLTSGSGGILRTGTNSSLANDIGNVSVLTLTSAGGLGFSGGNLLLDTTNLITNTSANNGKQFFTTLGKTITINSMNAGSGTITLSAPGGGKYQADGSIASAVTLVSGLLDGNGTTAALNVNNSSTLQPGDSPGILHTGNLTLASTATFIAQIGGTAPGFGYSQDVAGGTINLGGATLNVQVLSGFVPAPGQSFVLIVNRGPAPVTGTFASLPEGASVTVNGYPCHITYSGGAGKDVALIANGPGITTSSLPNWTVNQPGYIQTINTTGGSGIVTFSSTGTLPAGLTLSTSGVLSGTPTAVGNYTFTVTATDSASLSSSQNYTVTINPAVSIGIITLSSFNLSTTGAFPNGTVIEDSGGNLFATTYEGGTNGGGTVVELQKGSGTITSLASFNDINGDLLEGGVVLDSSGNLFGTTSMGGASNKGTVFEVHSGSGAITTLATFNGGNGAYPIGSLALDSSGNLFGAAQAGGASGDGTVFEVQNGSGTITTLAIFNGANGSDPTGGVVLDGSGNLFGITSQGGAANDGTVFEVQNGSGTITTLATFTNGSPFAGLIEDNSGNLFGTTYEGTVSPARGNVFEVLKGSGTITTLATFYGANGADPKGALIEDSSGNLFGTTQAGGPSGDGTIFEVKNGSGTVTTLASFNGINQANPVCGLALDSSGNLFGTTTYGGPSDQGTIFEVSPTLASGTAGVPYSHTFTAAGGTGPLSFSAPAASLPPGLALSSAGVLSGTTSAAGTYSFPVTATDTIGASATGTYTVSISPGLFTKYVVSLLGGSTVQAGSSFQVTVQAADQYGNPVISYSGPASVTATLNPTSTASSFPTTVSLNGSGVGFFLASLQKPGTYTIFVADSNHTYTGSAPPVTVNPGPAVKLGFGTQPVNTPTGVTLPPLTVQILDAYGNIVTSDNSDSVTISVASGPGGFTAGSSTTATVLGGVATFSNLTLVKPGSYTLGAVVPSLYIGPPSTSFTIAPLQILPGSFTSSVSGFAVQFNAPFLVNSLTPVLYGLGFGATAPVPSATLIQTKDASGNPVNNPVEGSLVLDTAANTITFVVTNTALEVNNGSPLLPDGTYTVTIHSSAANNGFQALNSGGGFLDGLATGTPGSGDYVHTFAVNAAASNEDVLWVPATADGPGQPLSAPGANQTGGGYPIYLSAPAANVTNALVTLNYNPALLTVTSVTGANFSLLGTSTPGQANLQYSGPALPAGSQTPLGFITARVPSGTTANPMPYKAMDLLHLSGVSLNGGAIPAATSDALHLVAYVGDADGNGSYSSNDAVLITRVALQTDSGFTAYPLVDPVIVADTDGAGFIPADAALQVNEAGVGFPTANLPIPPIPTGVHFQAIAHNVNPSVSLPSRRSVGAEGTVTVPVNVDVAHPIRRGGQFLLSQPTSTRFDDGLLPPATIAPVDAERAALDLAFAQTVEGSDLVLDDLDTFPQHGRHPFRYYLLSGR